MPPEEPIDVSIGIQMKVSAGFEVTTMVPPPVPFLDDEETVPKLGSMRTERAEFELMKTVVVPEPIKVSTGRFKLAKMEFAETLSEIEELLPPKMDSNEGNETSVS